MVNGRLMSEPAIRVARLSDAEGLFDLYSQPLCIQNSTTLFLNLGIFTRWFSAQLSAENVVNLIGVLDGVAVGHVVLMPQQFRLAHVGMLSVFVHDKYHRRGFASNLLTTILSEAALINVSRIQLEVFAGNLGAIALYERFGFRHEGRHPKQVQTNTGYLDTLSMGLLIDI